MRFVTFELEGKSRPGLVTGDAVADLSQQGFESLLDVIEAIANGTLDPKSLASSGRTIRSAR